LSPDAAKVIGCAGGREWTRVGTTEGIAMPRFAWVVALTAFLALAGTGRAQTAAVIGPGGRAVTLESVNGGDPFAAAVAAEQPQPAWDVSVGFSYLRPEWPNHGLSLRAATGGNPSIAIIRPFGDLSSSFGYVPRIDLQYDPARLRDLGFGLATSAQFLNITGNLERNVTLDGATPTSADLIASSNLSILIVDIAQITRSMRAGDVVRHPLVEHLGRQDDLYRVSVGTRYVSLRQTWNATLRGGSTFASSDASQTFAGLGLTMGLATDHPWAERWGFYSNNRLSLLVGPNNRKSVANGTDVGGAFNNSLTENKTILLPALEFELGVRYLAPLDAARWELDGGGPLLSARVGFVGQMWGGCGFLPAAATDAQFNNRPLYLLGVTFLAGIEY
jgi:hypothetical protein